MEGWYVAKVRPHAERLVQSNLEPLGVRVFAPEILAVRRGRKRLEPLFPGYLFLACDPALPVWRRVRWMSGVSYFLPSQREPAPVTDELVEGIQERVSAWNETGWEVAFQAGDPIHVDAGPLDGLDALFKRYLPGKKRCEVLVWLVGRLHSVTVDVGSLRHDVAYAARAVLPATS